MSGNFIKDSLTEIKLENHCFKTSSKLHKLHKENFQIIKISFFIVVPVEINI